MKHETTRALTVLALARDLLADEARWVKGALAVDRRGYRTDPSGSRARRWCAEGALERAAGSAAPAARLEAAELLRRASPVGAGVAGFNDRPATTHADIVALFDRAIEQARGK